MRVLPRSFVPYSVFGKKGYIVTSGVGGSHWKLDREGAENAMLKVSRKQHHTLEKISKHLLFDLFRSNIFV